MALVGKTENSETQSNSFSETVQVVDAIVKIFKTDPRVPGFSRPPLFQNEKGLRDKIVRLDTVFESESTGVSSKNLPAVTEALRFRKSILVPSVDTLLQQTLPSNGEHLESFALVHLLEVAEMSVEASHPVKPVNSAAIKPRLQQSVKIPAFTGLTLKVRISDITSSFLLVIPNSQLLYRLSTSLGNAVIRVADNVAHLLLTDFTSKSVTLR